MFRPAKIFFVLIWGQDFVDIRAYLEEYLNSKKNLIKKFKISIKLQHFLKRFFFSAEKSPFRGIPRNSYFKWPGPLLKVGDDCN